MIETGNESTQYVIMYTSWFHCHKSYQNIYQILKNYVTILSISLYDCNPIHIDILLDTKVAE